MLYFVDWTIPSKRKHRDCFNMVEDRFKVSFYEALVLINDHFNLGLLVSSGGKHIKHTPIVSKEKKVRKSKEIPFKTRLFNETLDKDFWYDRYEISKSDLRDDNVFPIIWYKIFSKRFNNYIVIRPTTRSYLIGNFGNGNRIKIYTPDKKGKGKWITNCTQNDIGGLHQLPLAGEHLIITKSYKDYRVLRNQGYAVVWFQNEGMIPKGEILFSLLERFKKVTVFFDNDATGIKASTEVANIINSLYPNKARAVHLPEYLLKKKISDPSDMLYIKGKKSLLGFLSKNRILI